MKNPGLIAAILNFATAILEKATIVSRGTGVTRRLPRPLNREFIDYDEVREWLILYLPMIEVLSWKAGGLLSDKGRESLTQFFKIIRDLADMDGGDAELPDLKANLLKRWKPLRPVVVSAVGLLGDRMRQKADFFVRIVDAACDYRR